MGQYYRTVNLDKKQYLHPHKFNDGLKLMEFSSSQNGTLRALAVLLADGNGRGGGDLDSNDPLVGSWAGDRIVVAGDNGDDGKFTDEKDDGGRPMNLYAATEGGDFEDISERIKKVLAEAGE